MQTLPPNLVIASLGPFAELLGVGVLVALFTLLRGQADRRPYFKSWEESWVMMAVALTAGVIYQRLTEPTSVLYASSHFTSWLFGAAHLGFQLLALALLVFGVRVFAQGQRDRWFVKAAFLVGVGLSLVIDTFNAPLANLALFTGGFAVAAYAYVAATFLRLPHSRRTVGSQCAMLASAALAANWGGRLLFFLLLKMGSGLAAFPWFVRFARYSFFIDLGLQLALAYAMVRLLFEDGRREANDARAQLKLMQDQRRRTDLYDEQTGLLNHQAFDAAVGLDFANASFGSVVRLRLTNLDAIAASHGTAVSETLLRHFAALLDSAVRTHDRVYRWDIQEFLIVMPRAVPATARARMQSLLMRAAPLTMAGIREAIRPEASLAAVEFSGAENLAAAVRTVAADPHLA